MTDSQHQFKPLEETQVIPVHWELNQGDYEKLHAGNDEARNHWHWYMENNTVHIYKGFSGIEHFRFTVHEQTNGTYLIENIETHDRSGFDEQAAFKGQTGEEIKEGLAKYHFTATEDVASMFYYFFDIKVDGKTRKY